MDLLWILLALFVWFAAVWRLIHLIIEYAVLCALFEHDRIMEGEGDAQKKKN